MKKNIFPLGCVILSLSAFSVSAQLYWDINGASPGAGGATPAGPWDTGTANWTTDSTGSSATGLWTDGNTAVFAAGSDATGSYTVTVSGTPAPAGLTFEEGDVTLDGGTLDFPGGGTFQVDASQATINSVISGGGLGGLTQLGTGTLVLGGLNTFSNTYALVQGTLRMGASGDILPNAALSISSGATLDLNNFSVGIGSLGVATFSSGSTVNLGSGSLTNLGIGPNSRYDGNITGSGNLVKTGTNTLTLGAPNTFTGRTMVLGGVLSLAVSPPADGLGTPPASYVADQLILDAGTLNFPATSPTNIVATRGVYLGPAGGTITMSSSKSPEFLCNITGPGSLIKPSTGNIGLRGINTFAGDFIIRAGGVRFNSDAAAGTGSIIVTPDANVFLRTLSPPGNMATVTNAITLNPGAGQVELVGGAGDTFILSGPISGTAPMNRGTTQTGNAGLVILSGDNGGWSGGFILQRGAVALGHKNALGTGATLISPRASGTSAAVLLATTPLTGPNAVTTPMNIAITNSSFHFSIGGANALEFAGPMDLGSAITPIITVTNTGGTIFSGNIGAGPGIGLTKDGANTLILSGANTYTGVTTISAGTLLVNAPGSLAGGGVVVNGGATLGGSGTVNGVVTVNAGGSIGAGASAGLLTLAAGLDLSAGGTNVWELAANSTAAPGTDFDQIVLTGGNLALGGSSVLQIRFTGSATAPSSADPFWQADHSWKIISLSGASNPGNTTFPAIDGTNGITAGSFAVSANATGVFLNYTTASTTPTATPARITAITGAGTTSVTVFYTNTIPGTNYVLSYSTNLASTNWFTAGTKPAAGTSDSQTDSPPAGAPRRFYRVYYVTP
jgi:fibronectin-binding autotransporter adhesin